MKQTKTIYTVASGKEVTLYTGSDGYVTIVDGFIIGYDRNGEMLPCEPSLAATLRAVDYTGAV